MLWSGNQTGAVSASATFEMLCDLVALVYHESRNVRHLIRQDLLDRERWRYLVALPRDRLDAWKEIAPLRDKAKEAPSAEAVLRLFEVRFHVALRDVGQMLGHRNWRHAKYYGGNAWAGIAKLTIELAEAIDRGDQAGSERLALRARGARHNTGSVREKLLRLEAALS
jgi:hypothetical protein